ncbi:MAG: hypothetical protein QGH06_08765 [Lutibacter sp.]|nr:hypothetical protein [Lutibacter sp.]
MKRKRIFIIWMVGMGLLSVACKPGNEHAASKTGQQVHTKTIIDNSVGLILNDGNKWQVNTETTTAIKNMNQIVAAYVAGSELPVTQLGGALQQELNIIFENCSMKGEAHDQLHNFLLPLIDKVEEIQEQEIADSQLTELQEHLALYGMFFN